MPDKKSGGNAPSTVACVCDLDCYNSPANLAQEDLFRLEWSTGVRWGFGGLAQGEELMPELPEIAVFARDMQKELVGRTISSIEVFQPKCLNIPEAEFRVPSLEPRSLRSHLTVSGCRWRLPEVGFCSTWGWGAKSCSPAETACLRRSGSSSTWQMVPPSWSTSGGLDPSIMSKTWTSTSRCPASAPIS